MTKLALLLAFAVPFAAAQDQKANTQQTAQQKKEPSRSARVFAIKYGDPDQIAQALRMVGANASVDRRMKMIVVSAEPSYLADIADIVQKLDIPAPTPKSVEVTAYLIQASSQASESGPIPTDLDPVIKQFRAMFNYQGFKLLDAAMLRSRETERVRLAGSLALPSSGNPAEANRNRYDISYRPSVVGDRIMRLEGFNLAGQFVNTMQTDLEFTEGQKVVVGKAGLEGGDRNLIVVLSGRIVQ